MCLTATAGWRWLRGRTSGVLLSNARIALDQGDPAQACRLARTVLNRDPTSYEALQVLAQSLVRVGDYAEARETANRALRLKPDETEPIVWKMRAYRAEAIARLGYEAGQAKREDLEQAIRHLQAALAVSAGSRIEAPAAGELDLERGLIYVDIAECHRLIESKSLLMRNLATESGQSNVAMRHNQDAEEQALAARDAEDRAVEALERAFESPPTGARAGEALQELYQRRGLYEKVLSIHEQLTARRQATERVALQAVGAVLSMQARDPDLKVNDTLSRARQILKDHLHLSPDSREAQIMMGRLSLLEGNTTTADRLANEVLKRESKNTPALVLKAQVLLAQGRFDEAKQILQPVSTFYPNWLEIQYSLALAQAGTGYESMAQQTLRRILVLNPQYHAARLRLAESLCKSGQIGAAESELREAIAASPSRELFLPAAVTLLAQYATRERAVALVDASLATGPSTPGLLEAAATQYWRLGKVRQAQECLARAGAAEGRSPTARLLRARRLIELNQPASAEAVLTQLMEEPAAAADARVELARLRYRQGRDADARKLLMEALRTPGITVSQRLGIAEVFLQSGDLDGALASARAALAADELSYPGQMLLGRILLRRGDLAGAQEAFAAAEKLLPDEKATSEEQAGVAMLRGNFQRAADICRSALQAGGAPPTLRLLAADALERMGRFEDAASELAAYISAEPDDLEGYSRLANLYLRAERPADGIKALERPDGARWALVRFAQSQILRATAGPTEAIAHLAPVLEDRPAKVPQSARNQIATTLATWQAGLGQTDDAVKTFDWLDEAQEKTAAAWGRFGVLTESGRLREAEQELHKIESLMPPESLTPADFERLARAQLRVGQTAAALATAARYAASFAEGNGPARLTMEIHRRSGNPAEAVKAFREAARGRPADVELLADGAALLAATHDYPGADEVLAQLSRAGPAGAVRAAVLRSEMLMRLGLYTAAAASLRQIKEQHEDGGYSIQINLAKALAAAGRIEESDAALRAVAPYSPYYVDALRVMAENAIRRGQNPEALALLDQVLHRRPNDPDAALAKIRLHLAARQVRPAVAIAATIVRRTNDFARRTEWWGILAELQWLSGDLNAAEETYRAWLRAAPQDGTARLRLALLMLARNRNDEAANLLSASPAVVFSPELARGLLILAGAPPVATTSSAPTISRKRRGNDLPILAAAARGDIDAARELLRTTPPPNVPAGDLERAIAAATDDRGRARLRRLTIGRAMIELGLREVVSEWMKSLAEEWPDEALVRQTIWEALRAAGRPAEAAKEAEHILERCKDSVLGKELAVERAAAQRRYDEAWKILAEIASSEGETVRLCIQRGKVLERQGRPAEAAEQYRRASELDPTDPGPLNDEAYVLANAARRNADTIARAADRMQRAASLGPLSPEMIETLGWIRILRGDTADGLASLSTAIEELRDQPAAHYHMGVAYKEAGRTHWARLHLENVLSIASDDLPEKRLAAELLTELRIRGELGARRER